MKVHHLVTFNSLLKTTLDCRYMYQIVCFVGGGMEGSDTCNKLPKQGDVDFDTPLIVLTYWLDKIGSLEIF